MSNKLNYRVGQNMTFADFIVEGGSKAKTFRRDVEKLQEMGITPEVLTAYEQMLSELREIPTDTEMETEKMVAVDEKNKVADEIISKIKKISIAARQVYKNQSSKLNNYNSFDLSSIHERELVVISYQVARQTKENISDFSLYNITEADCDELLSKSVLYQEKLFEVNQKSGGRSHITRMRWEKSAEAYQEMMRICEIGKFIWADISEAHYNDYVIYSSPVSSKKSETEIETEEEDNFDGVPENDYNS